MTADGSTLECSPFLSKRLRTLPQFVRETRLKVQAQYMRGIINDTEACDELERHGDNHPNPIKFVMWWDEEAFDRAAKAEGKQWPSRAGIDLAKQAIAAEADAELKALAP